MKKFLFSNAVENKFSSKIYMCPEIINSKKELSLLVRQKFSLLNKNGNCDLNCSKKVI